MANQSPSRPRTKTTDFTDFFRGAGQSNQLRQPQIQKDSPSMNLEVPTSGDESSASISKKKITRIPLFGRSRKKSNQSTASSPFATSGARHSTEVGEPSSRAPSTSDRRPSEPTPPPPLPVPSRVPSKSTTSLTSKFAAHFSHSRSTKVLATPQAEPPLPPQPVPSSSGLVPPEGRPSSLESSSSRGTRNRSTTPRPSRPTITVSLSADTNPDEFKNLFTRPTDVQKRTSKVLEKAKQHTPSSSPITPSPESAITYKRGQTPASAIAAAVRHQQNSSNGSNRPPSTSSKTSDSRKNSDSDKSNHDGTSTPRPSDSPRDSPRLEKGLPPSLSRRVSSVVVPGSVAQSSDMGNSSLRSRMKPPSTHSRSKPPSIPLPLLPPSSPPPSTPLPSSPADLAPTRTLNDLPRPQPTRTESGTSQKVVVRPRAHTISSSVSGSVPVVQTVTTTTPAPSSDSSTPVTQSFDLETLDIDTASVELLRQALKARNKQYADLTALVLKMTEEHVGEVSALEKKISVMEKEARKRDTQIKGFTWLFNDRESSQAQPKALPSAVMNQSRFAPSSTHVVVSDSEYDGSAHKTPYGGASRRLLYQSDSGAESHATSGAESLRASGSESTHSTKIRISRTATMMRSPKIPPAVNGDKFVSDIPSSKRSSMSSFSASPSSSTSSLLPPSPSVTMSSLSAIPEVANAPETLRLPRHESSSELSEERRAARASQRVSISSLASSSTAASSSYSVNIKRSRPPSISIAQVLEKSPEMQDTLDNLRRYS